MFKRIFDIATSLVSLILLSPIFIFISFVIYFNDRGPVFFSQKRVGLAGRDFQMLKFRSMVVNAEQLGSYSTEDNDSRITKVGKLIRKTSIDELPQLFNVLVGDMSIVGPRPDVPAQEVNYTAEEWQARNSVRPGITGLSQATLRSSATEEERTQMDLHYVNHNSLVFDLKIILMTIKQVLFKGGN